MRRRHSPVQQWVDSIPSPIRSGLTISSQIQTPILEKPIPTEPENIPCSMGTKTPTMTVSAPVNVPGSPGISSIGLPSSLPHNRLARDPSLQSDSSHCSSVESLLELRKADPEAILMGLGFGGCTNSPQDNGPLSRIPKRFLQPSKLKGIAINDFVKHQQETSESFDSVSLGYRGLTGSPYVAPSEIVQKIMERLREHESNEIDSYAYNYHELYSPLQYSGTQSVLSPDNRQFLERQRSKSPDMRNKRMIIGQKSFAFGHDGDLIEVEPTRTKDRPSNCDSNKHYINAEKDIADCFEMSTDQVDTSQKQSSQDTPKVLPKQLSFDDSLEFNDSDNDVMTYKPNHPLGNPSAEHTAPNIKMHGFEQDWNSIGREYKMDTTCEQNNVRRGSDSSYDAKSESLIIPEGRRYSDSIVRSIKSSSNESLLSQKRKTLKRQSRISDSDGSNHSHAGGMIEPETTQLECHAPEYDIICQSIHSESSGNVHVGANTQSKADYARATSATVVQTKERSIQSADDIVPDDAWMEAHNKTYHLVDQACCYKDEAEECADEKSCIDCCCRIDTSKYWKEMRKIKKENKKLGNLVAKNNREMAEIREMLSNVLSVRMEPGF